MEGILKEIKDELKYIHDSINKNINQKSKQEKKQWILDYMREMTELRENYLHEYILFDVVSEEFVYAYIEACNPKKVSDTAYGVPNVPELGRYLSEMYKEGLLTRYTYGLTYMQDGYPKWVYVYNLNEE